MKLFIIGLVCFFGVHIVPITPAKPLLVNRLGEALYSGLFSLLALFGFIFIVYGFQTADTSALWSPFPYSRELAFVLMPIAVIFLMPGSGRTNFFQKFKHPMFVGIFIWAFAHLLANGDLRSTLLFCSFALYCLVDMMFTKNISKIANISFPVKNDIIFIGLGVSAYIFIVYFHQYIAGVRILL
tara:strand:+ start:78 stop:629 length:552 start_codon:yes stop_codon:yes gene_type:complete